MTMLDKDSPLFGKTSLSDIFSTIYKKSEHKDKQIQSLIANLEPLVQTVSDAAVIVPLIKEYLEVGVKNDDHKVKLAAIAQRLLQAEARKTNEVSDPYGVSAAEMKALREEAVQFHETKEKEALENKLNQITQHKLEAPTDDYPFDEDK